jgi:DNA-binding CsgD family transcriptional regulator
MGSPLEREAELVALTDRLRSALLGRGSAVAVSGEAGAGKSTLVLAACQAAASLGGSKGSRTLRVLRGGCDPLATARPLGPFRDLFAHLPALSGQVLLSEVCEAVFAELREVPTLLVVEDLHWVDAASVEVLRFLVRRCEAMPCVVVVTYRDEIDINHPARPLIGDFAVLEPLLSLRLPPLSPAGVAALLEGTGLDAAEVHALTGGNPFFTAEVAKAPDLPLPETVRDAVLARTTDMAPHDFEVLQLAAAAPDRVDDRLLPALGVDLPTLRRLQASGLLTRNDRGLLFRHELARLAVESTIPAGGLSRLHARLLDALERTGPGDAAVLTHHAVAAADAPRAARYAEQAGYDATRAGAHAEAAAFFQIALSHYQGSTHRRAVLLTQLAFEQYMINKLDLAIASITATFPLWDELGDAAGLSSAHEQCAVYEYYSAHRARAEQLAERAVRLVDDGSEGQSPAYAAARLTRAYLAFQRSEYALSAACSDDGLRIGHASGIDALVVRAGIVRAATDLAHGEADAREELLGQIERARATGLEELASTGYTNLSYLDVDQRRLSMAESVLEESLALTVERDIPICNHWQTAVRSRLRMLEGRWDAALEDADACLRRPGMAVAQLWPTIVEGLVLLRRQGSDEGRLDEAWQLAQSLDEPLRRLPVLAALAERTWLTGIPDARVGKAAEGAWVSGDRSTTWVTGDLALWLRRIGLTVSVEAESLPEPYRLTFAGRPQEAATWWRRANATYDEAMAWSDSDDPDLKVRGIERLDLLGATATADRLRRDLREQGVEQVPQRPRASTRANPAGLTNRQLDVARLVARGFTNAEIAARLFISAKTADHHVSAVLATLGMPNRRAVVVRAGELGLA